MIDTDDLDRLLRDELTAAADHHESPGDPAPRVATRVRHRRTRRTAARVSLAASVTLIGVLAFASARPTATTEPADRPPALPSVLSTPQVASDRFARTLLAETSARIDWASVRLLEQEGSSRLFGARTTSGDPCMILVLADPRERLSAGTDCGPRRAGLRNFASRFATRGDSSLSYVGGRGAIGFFVPDGVTSATVDGAPIPVTRNGLLVVFTAADSPRSITLSSKTGTVTYSYSPDSDGLPIPTISGSFE